MDKVQDLRYKTQIIEKYALNVIYVCKADNRGRGGHKDTPSPLSAAPNILGTTFTPRFTLKFTLTFTQGFTQGFIQDYRGFYSVLLKYFWLLIY